MPNSNYCNGTPCPWHGTKVASCALSIFDDGIGSAGPASEVARPIFVKSPAANFWDYLEYVFVEIPRTILRNPDSVNISASADIPAGYCLLGICTAADIIGEVITSGAGIMVFASAGNDGKNVDAEDCFIFCCEEAIRVSYEIIRIICVGGLEYNDNYHKAHNSAYDSKSYHESEDVLIVNIIETKHSSY